jgi:hypothetical protein
MRQVLLTHASRRHLRHARTAVMMPTPRQRHDPSRRTRTSPANPQRELSITSKRGSNTARTKNKEGGPGVGCDGGGGGCAGSQSNKFGLILATNRPADLDEAVLDRMDELLEFGLPGEAERQRIFSQHLTSYMQPQATGMFSKGTQVTHASRLTSPTRLLSAPPCMNSRMTHHQRCDGRWTCRTWTSI